MKPGVKPASNLQRPAPLPTNGLRNFLLFIILAFAGFSAYAYVKDPAGCQKVLDDSREVVTTLMPGQAGETKDTPIVGASIGTTSAPVASAPTSTAAASTPPPVAPTTTTTPPPPAPAVAAADTATPAPPDAEALPAQPNWTWTTLDGKVYQNVVITKMDPDVISITHSTGVSHIPMSLLSDDIKKQLHYDPAAAAAAAAAITKLIQGKLVDGTGTPVKAPGGEVQYYAIYYSAAWCPPCHAFTPKLVAWYNKFKAIHPNFEVVFVSDDHSLAEMLGYMKEMKMPWLAINYSDVTRDGSSIGKYAGSGIPDLVLVDAGGKVLADSFQGADYVGPESVVDQINHLVGGTSPVPL